MASVIITEGGSCQRHIDGLLVANSVCRDSRASARWVLSRAHSLHLNSWDPPCSPKHFIGSRQSSHGQNGVATAALKSTFILISDHLLFVRPNQCREQICDARNVACAISIELEIVFAQY